MRDPGPGKREVLSREICCGQIPLKEWDLSNHFVFLSVPTVFLTIPLSCQKNSPINNLRAHLILGYAIVHVLKTPLLDGLALNALAKDPCLISSTHFKWLLWAYNPSS